GHAGCHRCWYVTSCTVRTAVAGVRTAGSSAELQARSWLEPVRWVHVLPERHGYWLEQHVLPDWCVRCTTRIRNYQWLYRLTHCGCEVRVRGTQCQTSTSVCSFRPLPFRC